MSQIINHKPLAMLLTGLLLAFAGCSNPNPQSNFDPDTGRHPGNWYPLGHMAAARIDLTSCADCHGQDFKGGISKVSCRTCHINTVPASFSCSECHGFPPSGTVFPNVAGRHASHQFPNVSCLDCHWNTVGTARHDNGIVDVAISATYYAKSGIAAFASPACSQVSCHGGQTAPDWFTGTIDVNAQCTSCHAFGTGEYNSFFSGQHDVHVNQQGIGCTQCHDTAKLAVNHFSFLNTSIMEGPAWTTLLNSVNYNGLTCSPPCHETRFWR